MDWLRPESAIFNFMQLKSLHKYRSYFHYPTLDMGCGNGLISSIFFGGKLNFDFDNYGSIDLSNTDVYNSHTGSNINILSKKPSPIGYGIDIKVNSINNAKDLNVFDDLNVGDIRNLPFENNSVSTVFSNMIDDIKDDDLSQTFKEIYRVLRPDQYVIFTSPSEDYRNSLFYYPEIIRLIKADKADKAQQYKQYDRGRSHWLPRTTTFWKDFLEVHSFKLEVCESFLDDRLLKIWDVGLRPFFPKLLEIRNEFNNNNMLRELKSVIVEIFENYFFNIVNKPLNNKSSFLIIIAKKIG
ncbi:MAG: class I SAM-dependent methyltransferase [Desulfobacterales bacterium]|nr:class I SAM-dependent methyltransferase [Desulfobacterales bacterium]